MMDGMGTSPKVVRRQRQYADRTAKPVVQRSIAKERSAPAIMLNHEKTHKEARCRNGQQQNQSVLDVQRQPHQKPQAGEWHDGNQNFDGTASMVCSAALQQIPRQ